MKTSDLILIAGLLAVGVVLYLYVEKRREEEKVLAAVANLPSWITSRFTFYGTSGTSTASATAPGAVGPDGIPVLIGATARVIPAEQRGGHPDPNRPR